jgi:hypothetical protein
MAPKGCNVISAKYKPDNILPLLIFNNLHLAIRLTVKIKHQ